jgi:pectinesterase
MGQYVISDSDRHFEGQTWTGNLNARKPHEDGRPYHTFRTYTVLVDGNSDRFTNCTFENTAGPGETMGQAIAAYLDGDGLSFENCTFRAHQDTVFLAPLPLKEREKDGFLGPKQFAERKNHTFHFKNCLFEGSIDFIFGGATAYFDHCEFRSNGAGYVFAPNTPEDVKTGFVARNCTFTCTDDVKDASCYIARPWRPYAKVRIENCLLGRHIHPQGWHDWDSCPSYKTVQFIEKGSHGPGWNRAARPSWVQIED